MIQTNQEIINQIKPHLNNKGLGVIGSARTNINSPLYSSAIALGSYASGNGYSIITGGGPGIMAAANFGVSNHFTESVGLPVNDMPFKLDDNFDIHTITHRFVNMSDRKEVLFNLINMLVVFPGGFGTLDELFEILTLIQTNKIEPIPIYLYDVFFWQPIINELKETMFKLYNTIDKECLKLFTIINNLHEIKFEE